MRYRSERCTLHSARVVRGLRGRACICTRSRLCLPFYASVSSLRLAPASVAIMGYMRSGHLRSGDEREREREGGGLRPVELRYPERNDLGGREGTEVLGTKIEVAALLLIPPAPEGRGPPGLYCVLNVFFV